MYRNRSNGEVQQIYLESGINAYLMRLCNRVKLKIHLRGLIIANSIDRIRWINIVEAAKVIKNHKSSKRRKKRNLEGQ
ncbi:hypothetical protein FWK35_00030161 [Aphis craccivora]|uniref:Uncharacterized protein n=1 Tax=Aphis craccivora TaxID=307492 RepID=A0A6G0ZH69_APHCR|nr:hypothetical protein FWK35_00030161 [Aphis craccivora]